MSLTLNNMFNFTPPHVVYSCIEGQNVEFDIV